MRSGRYPSAGGIDQPSADRLHEISRSMLMYYAKHRVLPPSLGALKTVDPSLPPLIDPVTNRGYVYLEHPRKMAGRPGWLMLHVPAAEAGMSWVILGDEADKEHNLATQVVLIPTSEVTATIRAPQPPTEPIN